MATSAPTNRKALVVILLLELACIVVLSMIAATSSSHVSQLEQVIDDATVSCPQLLRRFELVPA
jgi:hypothetical protein